MSLWVRKNYVGWKQRKQVASDLQSIYRAPTREEGGMRLEEFAESRDSQFPIISRSWRSNWERITPVYVYPQEIRRVNYMTNAIESVNMSLRKQMRV